MAETQHPKHQSGQSQSHDLVKPGSTMDPKGQAGQQAQGQQGQQGQQHQGGQQAQGVWPQSKPSEQDREQLQKRQQEAWDLAAKREKDNNPATKEQREYDKNAPGMNPANQPAPDTKMNKATRLDLEDITGNPGHRGINPDAPAGSINKKPDDKSGHVESINEPSHFDQNWPKRGNPQDPHHPQSGRGGQGQHGHPDQPGARNVPPEGGVESINEPPGSQVIPPGAGAGSGEEEEHPPGSIPAGPLKLTSIEPDTAEIGGGNTTFGLTVTGEGFDSTCKIIFDDEEVDTDFVNETTLRATPPMGEVAGEVDVEVEKGSESSEVLTFEFTEAPPPRTRKQQTPKPKKPTRAANRSKSDKKRK